MAEVYNLPTPHYYVVAVTKQRDNSSELIYLKRKSTCHTGVSLIFIILMLLEHKYAGQNCSFLIIFGFLDRPRSWMDHTDGVVNFTGKSSRLWM